MFNNTPTNNPRGNKNKKMIPCKYFAMGTCNKGDDCPYSHAIPPQNGASMENKNQNANKKPHNSRFERSIGQMNGNITALTKATSPYLCVAGSSSNSFVMFDNQCTMLQPVLADGCVTAIEVHNDLYYIATAASMFSKSSILILQPSTNNSMKLEGEKANIVSMHYTDDYNMLFVAYDNGQIHCWNLTDHGFQNVISFTFGSGITCMVYTESILIVGLQGGNIGIVMLCDNIQQENHIADTNIINLHVVDLNGEKELLVVFEGGQIVSYSIPGFTEIHRDVMNARIFSSCICQTITNDWMIVTSCESEGRKPVLSVLKVQTFEKKGLIHELPAAAMKLVNIGKINNAGDYVIAGCSDGSFQLFNLSH